MKVRSAAVPVLATLAAILAAVGWQYLDLQAQRATHLQAHARYGEVLCKAVEGIAVRELRGGRYSPDAVHEVLTDAQQRFLLQWVAIETSAGDLLASAGVLPGRVDPLLWFERAFVPLQPLGRGPRWNLRELQDVPAGSLQLQVLLGPGELEQSMQGDLRRMLTTSTAFAITIALVAVLVWLRTRGLALGARLQASQARLEGLETLRRLGAGLLHETKNPLGVVRGFAERIANGQLDSGALRQTAHAILEETDRTVARLDEFLLLSRPAELRRSHVPLRPLFEELALLLQPDFDNAGGRLVLRAADLGIDADREQLRRLLMNLLLNAVQALDRGGTVELACEQKRDHTVIAVSDDGNGVPEALRQSLFEPYVSGRPGGTGLGLAIARRIANDHGFALRYEPRLPRGTRMLLEVPS